MFFAGIPLCHGAVATEVRAEVQIAVVDDESFAVGAEDATHTVEERREHAVGSDDAGLDTRRPEAASCRSGRDPAVVGERHRAVRDHRRVETERAGATAEVEHAVTVLDGRTLGEQSRSVDEAAGREHRWDGEKIGNETPWTRTVNRDGETYRGGSNDAGRSATSTEQPSAAVTVRQSPVSSIRQSSQRERPAPSVAATKSRPPGRSTSGASAMRCFPTAIGVWLSGA